MNKTILQLDNVHVSYGSIEALKGVSLTVAEGEIACLIGANGAGKSTLLKSVMGLEPLTRGTITFDGNIITAVHGSDTKGKSRSMRTDKITALGLSMTPEGRGIFPEMTVLENLEMGAFLLKSKSETKRRIEEKYEMFSILRDRRKQLAGSLSGGEQQMLSIARALMISPRLLMLDEPALGLAPIIIKNIFDIIVRINREENVTIFLVEQNAKMALAISHKGYVLETGNIVLEDASSSLLQNPGVKAAYLGE